MGYRRSALFMIRRKYSNLDLFDVDLTLMEGYNIPDPMEGSELIRDLNIGDAFSCKEGDVN